jgi:hypothetical protein
MNSLFLRRRIQVAPVLSCAGLAALVVLVSSFATGQEPEHGRKYKPIPAMSHISVVVLKGFNSKPIMNAAVIFHATKDGDNNGSMEVKTDEDGKAVIDVIEVGSKVNVQVIATGFATYSQEIKVNESTRDLLVKMQRPQQQISKYQDNDGQASTVKPGVQEHKSVRVAPTAPATAQPQ